MDLMVPVNVWIVKTVLKRGQFYFYGGPQESDSQLSYNSLP